MHSDRRAVAAGRRLDLEGAGRPAPQYPTADPYAAAWLSQFHPALSGPRVESGVVVDALPGAGAYRVSAGAGSYLWCSPGGTAAGFSVTGARPLHTFPVGTPVYFVRHPETAGVGTLVAAEPHQAAHTANQPADSVWPFTRSGQWVEAAHAYPFAASAASAGAGEVPLGGADAIDLSAGRPPDATGAGEWGVLAETGVGVFADPFQAYLRADESAGVFAFYPDQLLRVAGHNYQHFTAVREAEDLDDEGELAAWRRDCVYPWEYAGLWRFNQVTPGWSLPATPNHGLPAGQGTALNDPVAAQYGAGYAAREPESYAQLPAARIYGWGGYLGQGGKEVIAAPMQLGYYYPGVAAGARAAAAGYQDPTAAQPGGRLTVNGAVGPDAQPYAVPPNARGGPDQPGLFEEQRTVTGGLHVRSNRRIVFAKYPNIPVARPVRRPEDPYGDSPTTGPATYTPSGLSDNAATHLVKADLAPSGGSPHRCTALPDVIAYLFNWEGLHPFAYHARDWAVAEEGAAGSTLVNQHVPTYASLEAEQYLAPPDPNPVDVDHRYGLSPVYENESAVCLLDDGTVVIYDGWGSELRMTGGNIQLRCAGDIELDPGRTFKVWAGDDAVVRAQNSVDLTAANGDVRTKAEHNSHHLSGNSGCGGFLFESKARCPALSYAGKLGEDVESSGFMVLCQNSAFLVDAQDVSVGLSDTSTDGRIVLDSGDARRIVTQSKDFVTRVSSGGAVVHLIDSDGTAPATANEFRAAHTLFGNDVFGQKGAFFHGCVTTNSWLQAKSHVMTGQAATYSYKVAAGPADFNATDTAVGNRFTTLTTTYATDFKNQNEIPPGYFDAEFSLRTADQYRTTNYVYWESRWALMADADGQDLSAWSEPPVVTSVSTTTTYPHPGLRWTASQGYAYTATTYVDPAAGWVAVPRGADQAAYESGTLPDPSYTQMSTVYPVAVPANP